MDIKERYIAYLEKDRKSKVTITNYTNCLESFADAMFFKQMKEFNPSFDIITNDILDLYNDNMRYREKGRSKNYGLSSNTIKLRFNAIVSFIEFLKENNLIQESQKLITCIKNIVKEIAPDFKEKEILTENELRSLFDLVQEGRNSERRSLMLFCLCQLGMRRAEVSNLKITDVNIKDRKIRIFGKGSKYRTNTLNDKFIELYENYLKVRGKNADEYVFCSSRSPRMCEDAIYKELKLLCKKAGIAKNLHPHMLRRTYASILYKKGVSILVIQKLLGHSSDLTTRLYFAIDETDMTEANNKFDIF